MPLTLRYTGNTTIPVEIEGLTPTLARERPATFAATQGCAANESVEGEGGCTTGARQRANAPPKESRFPA